MRRTIQALAVAALAAAAAACADMTHQQRDTVAGAAIGGVVGHEVGRRP